MRATKVHMMAPHQYVITEYRRTSTVTTFQSYNSTIAVREVSHSGEIKITVDRYKWDFSATTTRNLNRFLNVAPGEVKKRMELGLYRSADMNEGQN